MHSARSVSKSLRGIRNALRISMPLRRPGGSSGHVWLRLSPQSVSQGMPSSHDCAMPSPGPTRTASTSSWTSAVIRRPGRMRCSSAVVAAQVSERWSFGTLVLGLRGDLSTPNVEDDLPGVCLQQSRAMTSSVGTLSKQGVRVAPRVSIVCQQFAKKSMFV